MWNFSSIHMIQCTTKSFPDFHNPVESDANHRIINYNVVDLLRIVLQAPTAYNGVRYPSYGPLNRCVKLRVAHATGMPKIFPRHEHQMKPLVNDTSMHHGTCTTHVSWCTSGSLTRGGGEIVPGISGACATRNFLYLVKDPCRFSENLISVTPRSLAAAKCDVIRSNNRLPWHVVGRLDYQLHRGISRIYV